MLVSLERNIVRDFGGVFQPDRRIRSNRKLANLPLGHVPDAIIERAGQKPVAFELELSRKTPKRVQRIIDEYATGNAYARVYYLTDDEAIAKFLARFTQHFDFITIKVFQALPKQKAEDDQQSGDCL